MSHYNSHGKPGRRPYRKNGGNYYSNRKKGGKYNPKFKKRPPVKLSLWDRILAFFGLGPAAKNKKAAPVAAPKTNTRVAKNKTARTINQHPVTGRRLYVGNLSYEATETDLEDVFKGIGEVSSVEIVYNPRTHRSKGYAFVEMKRKDDAVRAMEVLHNQPFMGRNLMLSGANDRQQQDEENIEVTQETSEPLIRNNTDTAQN